MLTFLQIVAAAVVLWYTNGIIVKDQTTFSLEHLLGQAVEIRGLDNTKDVVQNVETNLDEVFVYGTVVRDDAYRLAIGRRDEVATAFPEGWYL